MKKMYVNHADMYMTLRLVIRITESKQEQLSRICRKIGYAHGAEWEKKNSQKKRNSPFFYDFLKQ